jgi:hypothetical protein
MFFSGNGEIREEANSSPPQPVLPHVTSSSSLAGLEAGVATPPSNLTSAFQQASQNAVLAREFSSFQEKVEAALLEHSQRLAAVCDVVSGRTQQQSASCQSNTPSTSSFQSVQFYQGPAQSTPACDLNSSFDRLALEFYAFRGEIRQKICSIDEKLDSIMALLRSTQQNF